MSNLTAEQNELLNTKFSPELEKQAAAQAALISDLYSTGFSKLASEHAEEEDKKEKEEDKKELKEEHEKEASDRGAFISRGFIDGLMKEGSERHQDEFHYLIPFIAEKLAMDGGKVKAFLSENMDKLKGHAAKAGAKAKEVARDVKQSAHKHPGKAMAGAGAVGALAGYKAHGSKKEE